MTIREFSEAFGELCEALAVFEAEVHREPTIEARNVMFHRDRLLDCLEDWHQATEKLSGS